MAEQHTPQKTHIIVDKCVICGLSFSNIEITGSGRKLKYDSNYNKKLKLNTERVNEVGRVVPPELIKSVNTDAHGICVKCFRRVQSIIKSEEQCKQNKEAIITSFKNTCSNYNRSVKRLINTPEPKPMKKVFTPKIQVWTKTQIKSAKELQSNAKFGNTPVVFGSGPPLLPYAIQPSHIPVVCTEIEKSGEIKSRKSLFSSDKTSDMGNTVQMAIQYESGVKTSKVTNAEHIKMCKIISSNKNVEKGLLNIIKLSCPEDIVKCAGSIVQKECSDISKRQSEFVLNDKSYDGIMQFSWDTMHQQLVVSAPNTLHIVSAMISNVLPIPVPCKELHHALFAIGIALHGRNREMTTLQYLNGMVLLHGGCTLRDVERLSKLGICVVPKTARHKLQSWQNNLDEDLIEVRNNWTDGGNKTYQLVGDNWDKNIVPSYRTSQQQTQSIHLFHVIGVIDRIVVEKNDRSPFRDVESLSAVDFIPAVDDTELLRKELTFLVARSLIEGNDQMSNTFGNLYPDHLKHRYSDYAGKKTSQYSLGLFDCDEKKTQDVIKLLKNLSEKYVPQQDGQIIEEVFFGGDRLTDERIQVAQQAMSNGDNGLDRLEGFISKIEDFHRLMNFLEAIHRMTYNTQASRDRGTMYYYRNLLNARNVKGEVKNSYRAYKHLYYTVFDAMCCVLFLKYFSLNSADSKVPLPQDFDKFSSECKIDWLNNVCRNIINQVIFKDDLFEELREVLTDPNHEENYWLSTKEDGRFKCHFCNSSYSFLESLKTHEKNKHGFEQTKLRSSKTLKKENFDELNEYIGSVFILVALHKNLDSAVNMGDGHRVVRSAKYETPLYHKTNKIKYLIGSIHLTAMVSGTLTVHQTERLIANRFINMSGGRNHNISLDEYVEILNRDTKNTTSGFQTKESIIQHSKEFPHLVNVVKHFDNICEVRDRKGTHKMPSYKTDVKIVVADLLAIDAFTYHVDRKLVCQKLVQVKNPFIDCYKGLSQMIVRHKPVLPFRRLRNKYL